MSQQSRSLRSYPRVLLLTFHRGWNETYIYGDDGYCSDISATQCSIGRGGAFLHRDSSTWSGLSGIGALNSADDVSAQTGNSGTAGSDVLTINSTLSIPGFEIAIPAISSPDYSSFGLGSSSRILDAAKNAGAIASRSWSLFWGQTGLTSAHAHDGAVVLGGIDETQTTGRNYTSVVRQTSTCRSGMIVSVTDMTITLPDGTSGSLMNGGVAGQGVNYCLETEFPMITMLTDHFSEWITIDPSATTTGNAVDRAGGGPNIWGLVYPKANM